MGRFTWLEARFKLVAPDKVDRADGLVEFVEAAEEELVDEDAVVARDDASDELVASEFSCAAEAEAELSKVELDAEENDDDEVLVDQNSTGSNLCEPIVELPRRTANMLLVAGLACQMDADNVDVTEMLVACCVGPPLADGCCCTTVC